MPRAYRLNPFVNLFPDPRLAGKWVLQAPLPGKGLQRVSVDETKYSSLFELCKQYGDSALNYLDPDEDLAADERDELITKGVLITSENEPKKVLFSCALDSVEHDGAVVPEVLVVNPTLRFEPFDLQKLRTWAAEMSLSPFAPSVWVTDHSTGLRSGYWLTESQAAVVSTFVPGEAPHKDLDPALSAKLHAAGVLGPKGNFEAIDNEHETAIADATAAFAGEGYAVIRDVIPADQVVAMQKFYRELEAEGYMVHGEEFVPLRLSFPMEPFAASTIHRDLAVLMARIAREPVKPAYCYAASYLGGADLPAHTDRPQCRFSFSVQIDYRPSQGNEPSPWPLCLKVNGSQRAIHLAPGDALAYLGCDIEHSRPKLPEGHRSTSLFLHYVPTDFEGELI